MPTFDTIGTCKSCKSMAKGGVGVTSTLLVVNSTDYTPKKVHITVVGNYHVFQSQTLLTLMEKAKMLKSCKIASIYEYS